MAVEQKEYEAEKQILCDPSQYLDELREFGNYRLPKTLAELHDEIELIKRVPQSSENEYELKCRQELLAAVLDLSAELLDSYNRRMGGRVFSKEILWQLTDEVDMISHLEAKIIAGSSSPDTPEASAAEYLKEDVREKLLPLLGNPNSEALHPAESESASWADIQV